MTPFILKGKEVPTAVTKYDTKVYKIFLVLNIAVSFLKGAFWVAMLIVYYSDSQTPDLKIGFELSSLMCDLLLFITGFYLGCAICKIQDYFGENRMKKYINIEIFAVHASTFILFMISTAVLAIFQAFYYTSHIPDSKEKPYLLTYAACNFCSFLSQLCLWYIFWSFAAPENPLLSKDQIR